MDFKDKFYKIINTKTFNYMSNIGLVYFYIFLALLLIAVCFIKYMNTLMWFYLIFIGLVLFPASILLIIFNIVTLIIDLYTKEETTIIKPTLRKTIYKCFGFIIYLVILIIIILVIGKKYIQ